MRSVLGLLLIATLAYSTAIDLQKANEQAAVQPGEAVDVKDAIFCAACKDIVDDVENYKEGKVEDNVEAAIQKICNSLGFLAGPCKRIMTDVEDKLIEGFNDNNSPDQICQMADIC